MQRAAGFQVEVTLATVGWVWPKRKKCCPRPGTQRERGPGLLGPYSVVEAEGGESVQ